MQAIREIMRVDSDTITVKIPESIQRERNRNYYLTLFGKENRRQDR